MRDSAVEIFIGVIWIIWGVVYLVRSNSDEADRNATNTLFTAPTFKTALQRGWESGWGLGYLALGLLYFVWAYLRNR
jgi:hypothetical protein